MSLTTDSMSAADLAAVVGTDRRDGFFGGGDGLYSIIVLFMLMAMMNNGFGGFGGTNGTFPWLLASGNNTNNDVQRGFDQAALTGAINNVGAAVNALQPQLCNGFAGVNATINSGFATAEIAENARQMATMQQINGLQSAFQQCCCDNRAGIADLRYTVATENCQDRYEAAQNTRDIIENANRNNQAILDKLCQQEIDALKTQNVALQNQLNMATMQASQTAQTARILADNAAQTQALEQYLNPVPIPAYTVQNPNCCNNWNTCGA